MIEKLKERFEFIDVEDVWPHQQAYFLALIVLSFQY
jgi:hypothetical protein